MRSACVFATRKRCEGQICPNKMHGECGTGKEGPTAVWSVASSERGQEEEDAEGRVCVERGDVVVVCEEDTSLSLRLART